MKKRKNKHKHTEAAPENGWRPISTAPRDGKFILVSDGGMMWVAMFDYEQADNLFGDWPLVAKSSGFALKPIPLVFGESVVVAKWPPTLWMPLPAPHG